ncbi:Imidazole glycerol-phosphate dehydratase domain protein [mine drainage metagenome]|uniref:Imidazole glycerol-phosphate dehydratase domain protein n=1 Tax=mine drainage metagenome TaxID=410659 RepID=T1AP98_9ZZZZ
MVRVQRPFSARTRRRSTHELVPHFFRSLSDTLGATLHLDVRGENAHHMVEICFKAVARALRTALRREGDALPSTKGVL